MEPLPCPKDLRAIVSSEEFDARRLAPLVLSAAEAGDQAAGAIVEAAARELAGLVQSVAQRLGFASGIELAVTGGVLVHSGLLRERMLEQIAAAGSNVTRVGVVETSVRGAIRIARGMVAAQ